MPQTHSGGSQTLVTLVVIGLVVVRFLMRELRPRRIAAGRMFAAPLVVVALAIAIWAYMVWLHADLGVLVPGTLAALAAGAGIGWLVARFTTVSLDRGATILRGSLATVAIWVVALVLRLAGRFLIGAPTSHASLALNAVFVVMLAAALLFSRWRFATRASELRAGSVAGAVAGA